MGYFQVISWFSRYLDHRCCQETTLSGSSKQFYLDFGADDFKLAGLVWVVRACLRQVRNATVTFLRGKQIMLGQLFLAFRKAKYFGALPGVFAMGLPYLLAGALWSGVVSAAVPQKINYQGYLTSPAPASVPVNGVVSMTLNIYNVAVAGAALYTETQNVAVTNGLFNVVIGEVTPLTLPFDAQYFLGITIAPTAELTPRQPLLSAPYALNARTAENMVGGVAGQVMAVNGGTAGFTHTPFITGPVGIGTAAVPSHKLEVNHAGSTGVGVRSTSGFSVVDIDAQSGDAALRFAKAGVNQWDVRNRPADDYFEIFELGGGGSRVVVQDGTGNVGIGETTAPSYKLDVLHGGSTGIRSRSSSSFSVVDIDAQSGDAALRFQKDGVNQWNVRNRPGDDNFEIFETGGGGSRFVIQDATGNVGIGGGATVAPSYKLDVEHGGSTGIRSKSTSSFSVIDIDAQSGDAALRFQKAGVNQWNIRNNPGTDDLQFFELGGGGERMRIENTTGRVVVSGDFTAVGTKAFTIDHPLDPLNKVLMHAAVESNEVLNAYSGNITTDAAGKATVALPDYFEALNKDFRYQLTVVSGGFAQAIVSREVTGNRFEIATSQPNIKVSWEVKGVRNDAHMRKFPFVSESEKVATMKGQYIDSVSHNAARPKAANVNPGGPSSIDDVVPVPPVAAKPANISGGSLEQKTVVPPSAPNPLNAGGSTQ
jgi:hypothetical protein